jgi:hypothetical protein
MAETIPEVRDMMRREWKRGRNVEGLSVCSGESPINNFSTVVPRIWWSMIGLGVKDDDEEEVEEVKDLFELLCFRVLRLLVPPLTGPIERDRAILLLHFSMLCVDCADLETGFSLIFSRDFGPSLLPILSVTDKHETS